MRLSQKIRIKDAPGKGRGVFATKTLRKGETIEICQLVFVPKSVSRVGRFQNYLYDFSRSKYAVALGAGSLYNHSGEPNATWRMQDGVLVVQARRKIVKGKEITISYGYRRTSFIE